MMELEVTARHFEMPPPLKELIEKEVGKLLRYYDGVLTCRVVLDHSNSEKTAQIVATAKGHLFTVTESHQKIEWAVTTAIEKLKHQISRYKEKLVEK